LELNTAEKIWDKAPHCAFTDLIRFQNKWFCCFREGKRHAGDDGIIRILQSQDGEEWSGIARIALHAIDLRDPHLSVMPDGQLMLLAGAITWGPEGKCLLRNSLTAFSSDGRGWTPFRKAAPEGEWLWRAAWHGGKAYGVAYNTHNRKEGWTIALYQSEYGVDFQKIVSLDVPGNPSETTLRFSKNGEMTALVRRGGGPKRYTWIGKSFPPYTQWEWNETRMHFGGPDFLLFPNGRGVACGRIIHKDQTESVIVAEMTKDSLTHALTLPSGGEDTGYPGMVYHQGVIWISYYSSHEGRSSIYLVKVKPG